MIYTKFILSICFGLLYCALLCAQPISDDKIDYYRHIQAARLASAENDLALAIKNYDHALHSNIQPFARDCFNAAEIALLANDTIALYQFMTKGMLSGIPFVDWQQLIESEEHSQSRWFKDLEAKSDSLRTEYNNGINQSLRSEVNKMFEADQSIRKTYYSTVFFKRNTIRKKWENLNRSQVERIMQITDSIGFPGEHIIGLDTREMHPKITRRNYSCGMPIVILMHHFSQPNVSYSEQLIQQVFKGNLHNEHFATICDFEAHFGKQKHKNLGYFGLRFKPKKFSKVELDTKRTLIGLPTLEKAEIIDQTKTITPFWKRLY